MTNKQVVGLLGGSFNPPHQGHVYISNYAKENLKLNQIWWVIAKSNPLKEATMQGNFEERYKQAIELTKKEDILIKDIEKEIYSNYTYDLIEYLYNKYPEYKFVWIMGADNLYNFDKWYKWQEILDLVPIIVFNRDYLIKKEKIYKSDIYAKVKQKELNIKEFKDMLESDNPRGWCFLEMDPINISSTNIRKSIEN